MFFQHNWWKETAVIGKVLFILIPSTSLPLPPTSVPVAPTHPTPTSYPDPSFKPAMYYFSGNTQTVNQTCTMHTKSKRRDWHNILNCANVKRVPKTSTHKQSLRFWGQTDRTKHNYGFNVRRHWSAASLTGHSGKWNDAQWRNCSLGHQYHTNNMSMLSRMYTILHGFFVFVFWQFVFC